MVFDCYSAIYIIYMIYTNLFFFNFIFYFVFGFNIKTLPKFYAWLFCVNFWQCSLRYSSIRSVSTLDFLFALHLVFPVFFWLLALALRAFQACAFFFAGRRKPEADCRRKKMPAGTHREQQQKRFWRVISGTFWACFSISI